MIVLIRLFVFVSLLLIGSAVSAQEPPKGFLGIELKAITKEEAEDLGWEAPRGVRFVKPTNGGPAARGGILPGDVILSIDGVEVENMQCFVATIGDRGAGAGLAFARTDGRAADAQHGFVVTPLAEKKLNDLPPGPLFWHVETFTALPQALGAAGETSLVAETDGRVWVFTLGPIGSSKRGGRKVAEIGPVAAITASEYLLRVNHAAGPPGARMLVHRHPGSEVFYVLRGRLGQRTPHGLRYAVAGQSMPGHGTATPMEIVSSGTSDLSVLVMFVVDATKPFSSPADFENIRREAVARPTSVMAAGEPPGAQPSGSRGREGPAQFVHRHLPLRQCL